MKGTRRKAVPNKKTKQNRNMKFLKRNDFFFIQKLQAPFAEQDACLPQHAVQNNL